MCCHCYLQQLVTFYTQRLSFHASLHSPLTVSHLHGLQLGVGSSVEAFHLLLLQPFKETDGILVDATSLRQHQWGGSIVVTVKQGEG